MPLGNLRRKKRVKKWHDVLLCPQVDRRDLNPRGRQVTLYPFGKRDTKKSTEVERCTSGKGGKASLGRGFTHSEGEKKGEKNLG